MYGNRIVFLAKAARTSEKKATEKCKSVKTILQKRFMQHTYNAHHDQAWNGSRCLAWEQESSCAVTASKTLPRLVPRYESVFTRFEPSQTETLKFLHGKVFCQRRPGRQERETSKPSTTRTAHTHTHTFQFCGVYVIGKYWRNEIKVLNELHRERRSVDKRIYFN